MQNCRPGPYPTVNEAFEEEKIRLIPLPSHRFETDPVKTVRSDKTIYVRFDQNDYSIPHEMVGRSLTLAASQTTVRILDGIKSSLVIADPMIGINASKTRPT